MAEVTAREPIRAAAPLDDPVLGTQPLTVNPASADASLVHGVNGRAALVLDPATRIPVVLLDAPGPTRGTRRREVLIDGWSIVVELEPAARAALRDRASRASAGGTHDGSVEVRAIIPGRVLSVAVVAGDAVTAGQPLIVVEAMKMQNELRAPRDGIVERVVAAAGATVELGDLLLVLA